MIDQALLRHLYRYDRTLPLLATSEVDPVREPVGLKPNAAKTDTWVSMFSDEDLGYFHRYVQPDSQFLYDGSRS